MKYLLDTDIASYFLRGKHDLESKFRLAGRTNLRLSIITVAQMLVLAHKGGSGAINFQRITKLADELGVVDVDRTTWESYAEIQARAEKKGEVRGELDTLQAALARQHNMIVVTHNKRHFQGLVDLTDWVDSTP